MKIILLLTLYSSSLFAIGGVNEGGTAGGSGTGGGTKPVMSKHNEDDPDLIESGKRCLNAYKTDYQFEKIVTVAHLKQAITDEITKPASKKNVGRSIASVSEAPLKINSMECHLFAKDLGDKEFLNLVLPADAPASAVVEKIESQSGGLNR